MITKTKDFQLSAETTFKNELIHFFNIDTNNSTLYIYLEIDGKRMKSEKSKNNYYKLLLKDIKANNVKKEINCLIIEDVELKILIKIISKYTRFFRKKSNTFYKKYEAEPENKSTEKKNKSPEQKLINTKSMSIKEKIKFFSGELIKKQINNKIIPGRLIMPKIFRIEENEDKKQKDNKIEKKEKK